MLALSHRSLPLQIVASSFAGDARDTSVPTVLRSCGHVIHISCLDSYLASLHARHHANQQWEGMQCVDLSKSEFCCPLCRQLANCIVPIPPATHATEATAAAAAGAGSASQPVFRLSHAASALKGGALSVSEWTQTHAEVQQWANRLTTSPLLLSNEILCIVS